MTIPAVAIRLAVLLALLPAVVGMAQIQTVPYQSPLESSYTAIAPTILLSEVGVGTGAIVLRGSEGCGIIAAWNYSTSVAEKGTGSGGGGTVNVGY